MERRFALHGAFPHRSAIAKAERGISLGLAWTHAGGEVVFDAHFEVRCEFCVNLALQSLARKEIRYSAEDRHGRPYSACRASTGLTEAARRAGMKLAKSAARASTAATAPSVIASQAWVPKSRERISEPVATEQSKPAPMPIAASHPASLSTMA